MERDGSSRSRSTSIPPYPPYPHPPPPPLPPTPPTSGRALSSSPARLSNSPSRTPLQLAPLHEQTTLQQKNTPTSRRNTTGNNVRSNGTMVTTSPPSDIISPRDNKGSDGRKPPHKWPKDPFNPAFYFEYWLAQNAAEKKALLSLQSRPEEFKENFFEVLYNWISFGKAALGWWGEETLDCLVERKLRKMRLDPLLDDGYAGDILSAVMKPRAAYLRLFPFCAPAALMVYQVAMCSHRPSRYPTPHTTSIFYPHTHLLTLSSRKHPPNTPTTDPLKKTI